MKRILTAGLMILLNLGATMVQAQERGALTVTATVVTSVALVTDANGQPKIVVANPSDRNDNVSYIAYAPSTPPANSERQKKSDFPHAPGKHKNAISQ